MMAVFVLAIATMIISLVSKPPFRPIQRMSVGLVALILLQIILGFATLSGGNQAIAWIHFVNAMAIYGLAVSGTIIALRWDQTTRARGTDVLERKGEVKS